MRQTRATVGGKVGGVTLRAEDMAVRIRRAFRILLGSDEPPSGAKGDKMNTTTKADPDALRAEAERLRAEADAAREAAAAAEAEAERRRREEAERQRSRTARERELAVAQRQAEAYAYAAGPVCDAAEHMLAALDGYRDARSGTGGGIALLLDQTLARALRIIAKRRDRWAERAAHYDRTAERLALATEREAVAA